MGVFDFLRRKPVLVEEPTIEQNVLVEEANEEKPVNNVVTITYGTGKAIDLIYNFLKDDYAPGSHRKPSLQELQQRSPGDKQWHCPPFLWKRYGNPSHNSVHSHK